MPSEAQQKSWRKYYETPEGRAKHLARVKKNNALYMAWAKTLKDGGECVRCGENHPACLDFHHVDPANKEFEIANGIKRRLGKDRIWAEIEKCVLLCANCHRKEHAAQAKVVRH